MSEICKSNLGVHSHLSWAVYDGFTSASKKVVFIPACGPSLSFDEEL